jgi:hypothetical protein
MLARIGVSYGKYNLAFTSKLASLCQNNPAYAGEPNRLALDSKLRSCVKDQDGRTSPEQLAVFLFSTAISLPHFHPISSHS